MPHTRFSHTRRLAMRRCGLVATTMVALSAVLAACGGGAGGSGPNDSTVKIGVLANVTGTVGKQEGGATRVLDAWARDVNARGGIGGREVELVIKDTRADAPTTAAAAEEFIADESVVGVFSLTFSTEGSVGQQIADSDLPVIGGAGFNPKVWGALPNWYGITTSFPNVTGIQVWAAAEAGATKLSQISCAEDPSCVASESTFKSAVDEVGASYAGLVKVAATAPNYTAECLAIGDSGADFIQLGLAEAIAPRVAEDCIRQGYTGSFGASSNSLTGTLTSVSGIQLNGGLNAFPWFMESPAAQNYRDVMAAQNVSDDDWSSTPATAAWASAKLFEKAMSGAASGTAITRDTVQDAYGAIKDETLDGLLPQPVTFTRGEPSPRIDCAWLYKLENGTLVTSGQPQCSAPKIAS